MIAHEYRQIAIVENFENIKKEYFEILEQLKSAAKKGDFYIEIDLEKCSEKLVMQLKTQGFSVIYRSKENDKESLTISF